MTAMKLAVAGAGGRMGRTLIRLISQSDGAAVLGAAIEGPGSPALQQDAGTLAGVGALGVKVSGMDGLGAHIDGLLDFTSPVASVAFAQAAAAYGFVHVIGSTGFEDGHNRAIAEAAKRATIIKSGNMSLGVNLLAILVQQAAAALDEASISKSSTCTIVPRSMRRQEPPCCWARLPPPGVALTLPAIPSAGATG